MILRRAEQETIEYQTLAGYGMKARDTRGRKHPLPESANRTCFQRDYDRIVHSKAFRRMEYKTQVFVNSEGDDYRTRLTHSMEVAQICRSVARTLRLNSDLAEAVALAHDLGHPPFGHAGENALNELLADHGGFNHNVQTLRTLDKLETRYPEHPGLNLSYEVREGIARHESAGAVFDEWEFPPSISPTLEAAIVDVADEIAYNSHDVDDGLASGLLTIETVCESPLCERALRDSDLFVPSGNDEMRRYALVRTLVGWQVNDVLHKIDETLRREEIDSVAQVRAYPGKIAVFSGVMQDEIDNLRTFLSQRLYSHPRVSSMAERGKETVRTVFNYFLEKPDLMPTFYGQIAHEESTHAAVRDYVAGMTDRFAERLAESVVGAAPRPSQQDS